MATDNKNNIFKKSKKPWIVHVSTYPPYEDGIATFTNHIISAQKLIFGDRLTIKVAAIEIMKENDGKYPSEVEWIIHKDEKGDYKKAAVEINKNPDIAAVFIQHEYGIFGGEWGNYLTDLLKNLKKPIISIFHTVLSEPTEKVHRLTQSIIDYSSSLIVLTANSKENLTRLYRVNERKIDIIPHGIHPVAFRSPEESKKNYGLGDKIILGTFGFLSPSKGIEYVIQALPEVIKKFPNATYWLMGITHPLIKKQFGESYRELLHKLADNLGVGKNIRFQNKFMTVEEELTFLSTCDIYISTSLNPDQTVSGTLSYALGTGRCVVSTKFTQARETIKKDMGILVNFQDPGSYTRAILQLLQRPRLRSKMHWTAYENTRHMLFPNVSTSYIYAASKSNPILSKEEVLLPEINFNHFIRMTDNIGFFQFAKVTTPDKSSGYTLDDNARALIACIKYMGLNGNETATKLAGIYLDFIGKCQNENGEFINYIGENRKDDKLRNTKENLEDALARALWALAEVMASDLNDSLKEQAFEIWNKTKPGKIKFTFLRSKAFYIKALYCLYHSGFFEERKDAIIKRVSKEADYLCYVYNKHSTQGHAWSWFEHRMTYSNALLPEALLIAYGIVEKENYFRIGIESLEFLTSTTFHDSVCIPIGNGWYERDRHRSYFDQQPEEVTALIFALTEAFYITGDQHYQKLALRAFFWFLGNNLLGVPLYDKKTGGCRDGLERSGVNENQGAESTISYLLARMVISTLFRKTKRYNRVASF